MSRDMTEKQFEAQLAKRGWSQRAFCGYVENGHGSSVSRLNAGDRRRDQLAYLISEFKRIDLI